MGVPDDVDGRRGRDVLPQRVLGGEVEEHLVALLLRRKEAVRLYVLAVRLIQLHRTQSTQTSPFSSSFAIFLT